MADTLHVELRSKRGTREARKLRDSGRIPGVLYGHGEDTVAISVPHEEVEAAVRHGAHMVNLEGGVAETAVFQDLQWDTFGVEILHVDFYRVRKGEKHEATVAIHLRGDAPGSKEGGVVQQVLHEVSIVCPVESIPDEFEININELHVNQEITAAELELPEGATLTVPPEEVVVRCIDASRLAAPTTEEVVEAASEEPEVIGRKEEEEGEGEGE